MSPTILIFYKLPNHQNEKCQASDIMPLLRVDGESSMISSKAMFGNAVKDPEYYRRDDRASIQTCLERIGGNWNQLSTDRQGANVLLQTLLQLDKMYPV